jgi:hypothetical protein
MADSIIGVAILSLMSVIVYGMILRAGPAPPNSARWDTARLPELRTSRHESLGHTIHDVHTIIDHELVARVCADCEYEERLVP